MKKIIEVKNLYKLYKLGDSAVRALNGVSLEIYEGEFCAIVGTSGSGKSTMHAFKRSFKVSATSVVIYLESVRG